MPFPFPTGDPENNKHLWWRCVLVAATVQPFLILLYVIFGSSFFRNIIIILYFPCVALGAQAFWSNPASLQFLFILLPVCIVLNSFILGAVFYFVCWLAEKDFDI